MEARGAMPIDVALRNLSNFVSRVLYLLHLLDFGLDLPGLPQDGIPAKAHRTFVLSVNRPH
jgi:hypothetical protein